MHSTVYSMYECEDKDTSSRCTGEVNHLHLVSDLLYNNVYDGLGTELNLELHVHL